MFAVFVLKDGMLEYISLLIFRCGWEKMPRIMGFSTAVWSRSFST
jgi:hypothetical protein